MNYKFPLAKIYRTQEQKEELQDTIKRILNTNSHWIVDSVFIDDNDNLVHVEYSVHQPLKFIQIEFTISEPKCDCGAEKTFGKGTNLHADWCTTNG